MKFVIRDSLEKKENKIEIESNQQIELLDRNEEFNEVDIDEKNGKSRTILFQNKITNIKSNNLT